MHSVAYMCCMMILFQPQSDLSGAIQVLVCVFGEEPPVFAKPQSQPASATQPPYPPHIAQPPAATTGFAPYPTSGHTPYTFALLPVYVAALLSGRLKVPLMFKHCFGRKLHFWVPTGV